VSTYRLGFPSDLKYRLQNYLPRRHETGSLVVLVTPRDRADRKCAAYDADHYEIQAYYTTTDSDALDLLEKALRELPGVSATTQVRGGRERNEVTNPDWPAQLGARRRGFHMLRPQVMALIAD
jgi:hypothetical protein